MTEIRFAKLTVLLNGLVPLALLGQDAWHSDLGANPINFAIRTTGFLTLISLLATLTITPASRIFGWRELTLFRRLLGLYAFAYGSLHFALFFLFDREAGIMSTLGEISMRVYLMFGTTALVLMIPLAVTSTDAMVRRLGYKRWKALHRLTYLIAIAGVVHYYLAVKSDVRIPLMYAGTLAVLLGYRVVAALRGSRSVHPATWSGKLRVEQIRQETHDVKTFRLVHPSGEKLPFAHLPGQYLTLTTTIAGKPVKRNYTIASSPHERNFCEVTIKRQPNGVVSRHLHEHLHVGDELMIQAPGGKFIFSGDGEDAIVMLAGGVGITPLMSKIRFLTEHEWPGKIDLLYSNREAGDIIFADELAELALRNPRLHIRYFLTRAEDRDWQGERGRITLEAIMRHVPQYRDAPLHICGPTEFNHQVKALLIESGIPHDRIQLESFGGPRTERTPSTTWDGNENSGPCSDEQANADAMFEIHFADSDQTTTVAGRTTVLEAAEELGVRIDYDCRAGICGTCKVRLLSGRVCMTNQDALDAKDLAEGQILACQAHCLSPLEIEA